MSIIIRLQNLPWNANAADIRQFFQNLTIPDGGVHIVGGENGDAFIAFGSDEDARQAMLLDGGKIKEAKIKLLLSSRTEMQKVIELARQQALTLQNLMQSVAAASSFGTSSLSMLPNVLSGMPGVPNLSSLPVATAAGLIPPIAIPAAPTGVEFKEMKMAQADAKSNAIGQSVLKDNGKSRSDGKTRSRSRSLSRSASGRSHSRSRSRSRERRYRDKHRYSGNRSRDRKWRHDKSRSKERSRSRDRYKKRSRSRDRRSRDRSRDAYKSRDRRRAYDKKEKSPVNDDKNEQRKNSDPKFKTTGSETNVKNEITFLEVLPVSDKMQSPNERSSNDISSAVASLLAKSSSNDGVASEFKPDAAKTSTESPKSWMNNVPMPPIISPWMLSQTNDADGEKKSIAPDTNASTEKKSDPSAVPYGMFPPQFPFGNGFPPPPTMYPFAGYASAATPYMGADKTIPSMPSMPMPPFFNPYQNAGTVQPGATDKNAAQPYKNSNCNSDEQDPSEKFAKLEHNEAGINNEYDDYEASNFRKRNKMNNYYNGDDTRNYNSGGHRRNDDGDSYDNAYSYSSRNAHYDDTNRRTYPRRNFSDTWDNGEHMDECDERKSDFEHRKNSAFAPVYFGSVCVEMVNLPRDAVVGDVKKFFLPLPLYESSIKFQSDGKDNSTRNAFVKFLTLNHKLQALKLSGKIMRGNRITISDMDPAVWEAAEDFTITLIDQHCLKISFIPKEAQKQDVLDALPNLPDDMILMKEKNKHSLVAYLKFADNTMVKNALADKHKMLISNSRVKLEPISEENFLIARADYQTSDDMESEPETEPHRRNHHVTTKSRNNPRWNNEAREINDEYSLDKVNAVEEYEPQCKEMNSNCLLLKNLPSPVTDIDIVDFFSDINIIPSQIHIMFNTDYKQNGDSFCEFDSENEAAEALLKKNYCKMKHNTIEITMVPREEVLKAIGSQLPEKYPSPRYNPPSFAKKPYSSRPAPPYRNSNPRGFPPRGPVAPFNRPTGPENFGKPGCVVALENVPYKADVDDILDFLGQFNVQRENIIRRFNEGGQPTGDARICLRNPVEAQKVVQLLDGKRMRDRVVFVSLVD